MLKTTKNIMLLPIKQNSKNYECTKIQIKYIKNAPTRERVLRAFKDEDFIRPIQIAKKTNLHPNNVSRKLRDLREHDLVHAINPEYHVPRLYRLTDNGKKIIKLLNQYE